MVAGACGSTRSSERLRPGSPRTGAPPRQAWDRPLRPNQDRPFRWLRAGSPRTGFGGLLRHEAHGCPGCLWRPCPWVPTRGTPTVDGLTTNEGWGVRCWVASGRGRFETGPTQLLRKTSAGMAGWLGASGVWFPSAGSGQAHQESERGTMRRWAGGRRKRVVRRLGGSTGDPRSQAARSLGR